MLHLERAPLRKFPLIAGFIRQQFPFFTYLVRETPNAFSAFTPIPNIPQSGRICSVRIGKRNRQMIPVPLEVYASTGGSCSRKFIKLGTPTLAGRAKTSHLTPLALPAARIFRWFSGNGKAGVQRGMDRTLDGPPRPDAGSQHQDHGKQPVIMQSDDFRNSERVYGKEAMQEQDFLALVRNHGNYGSHGEACRAAYAVFATVKSWLTPLASDMVREALPQDAAQLWQYSPVSYGGGLTAVPGSGEVSLKSAHFILKVQQLGNYASSGEARRAICSVFSAFSRSLLVEPGRFLGKVLPPEVMGACRASSVWAA